ncbi:phosphate ABC transporter substrate-binding/OmpA family protein [Cognatiyoonia sp. IB215182]|uniref:phosphate ABC transporter substrate-binding/OmpA family protein n=1 Tax=Cognatiyoonia sp. IB215182 TaxID=3097353 RepID=UPI002A11B2A6|nr:phosphate ABC transporter substrate-binding/OmpA family protein [Cognatiyoonia sp. IB215182]MDX8351957.1 phosphate ABC transporter substrate-binding/OmpA family protein [Cognatiyoonia sp. IB215182]
MHSSVKNAHAPNQAHPIRYATVFCLASFAGAPLAFAEGDKSVVLTARDGTIEIHGTMMRYEDEVYVISTAFQSELFIDASLVECSGAGCPSLEKDEVAEDRSIRLVGIDEDYTLQGELIAFSGNRYIIETDLGQLQINGQQFRCEGTACPEVDIYDPTFSVFANDNAARFLIPELLRGYARAHDLKYQFGPESDEGQLIKLIDSDTGLLTAEISLFATNGIPASEMWGGGFGIVNQPLGEDSFDGFAGRIDTVLQMAYDANVIIVGDDNPIRDLSNAEMAEIWSGGMTTWETLGGGTRQIARHLVSETGNLPDTPLFGQGPTRIASGGGSDIVLHKSIEDMISAVRNDPAAIGFVDRAHAIRGGAEMVASRKVCGLIAQPTDFDIRIQNYPFANPVIAYADSDTLHPVASDILAWSQTNAAQISISDAGFASAQLQRMRIQDLGVALIHNAVVEPDFRGGQFSQMLRELRYADRLSTTFRFAYGSSVLDAESVENIKDMVLRLRDNQFEGLEILLVGFADNIGDPAQNTALAQRRAETVQAVLEAELAGKTYDIPRIRSLSFGEQMPLDCNDTEEGRASNRRVEVWVRVPVGESRL